MRALVVFVLLPLALGGVTPSVEMRAPRAAHTATLLPSGDVLVVGGCTVDSCELDPRGATTEIYDADEGRFVDGPKMSTARVGHAAAALAGGRVLIAGGWTPTGPSRTAEVYDNGRFRPTGSLRGVRGGGTATPLRDGRVLIVGGTSGGNLMLARAEIYDPRTGRFTATGRLHTGRGGHVAVALGDGRVLVVGGFDGDRVLASTEIYDPRRGRFIVGPRLRTARHKHAAVALQDGRVLVVGGSDERDFGGRFASAELIDVRRHRVTRAASLGFARFKLPDAAVRLRDGSVFVAGGSDWLERYDVRRRRFVLSGRIDAALAFATATRLRDGSVLVVGGYDDRLRVSRLAWVVRPG